MRLNALTIFCCFYSHLLYPQIIVVKHRDTNKPIANVFIYTEDKDIYTISDTEGKFGIDIFKGKENIFFQHPSFHTIKKNYKELLNSNSEIFLNPSTLNLQEILVSANKWKQEKKYIANEILNLSSKEIAFNNSQTTADALAASGQVFIQKSQLGGGSPILRGFSANSTLIVIDGVRMNNAIFRSGNLQNTIMLDANSMESIEVIFGPGSVMYGSDALGGVMNFHTKAAKFPLDSKKYFFSGNFLLRYASTNNEKTIHTNLNYANKHWSGMTAFTFSDFDHLRTGDLRNSKNSQWGKRSEYVVRMNGKDLTIKNNNENLQIYSGYDQANFLQKVIFKPSDFWKFTYIFNATTSSDIPRYDRLVEYKDGKLRFAEWYYGPQIWLMNSLNVIYKNLSEKIHQVRFSFSYQFIKEERNDRKNQEDILNKRKETVNVYAFNMDAYKVLVPERHKLFYGMEYVYNGVKSEAWKHNIETGKMLKAVTRYPAAGSNQSIVALYGNYQWSINSYYTFSTGLRFNYVFLYADFSDKTFYDFPFSKLDNRSTALNGSIGLAIHPKEKWQFNLNFSNGFRAPNVDDIGKIFDSTPGKVIVPNPDLKSEYIYNAELGFQKIFSKKIILNFTTYYTLLRDAIVRRDSQFNGQDSIIYSGVLSKIETLTNTKSAYIWGISTQLSIAINKHLNLHNTFNYTKGKDTKENLPLRHVTPAFGKIALKYHYKPLEIQFSIRYADGFSAEELAPSIGDKKFLTDSEGAYPSWWIADISAIYHFKKSCILQVGLENILDKHYRPYSWGISAAGRNFFIAFRTEL